MANRFLNKAAFSVLALASASAQAGLIINLSEQTISGSTAIVAAYAGSLNLSSTTPFGSGTLGSGDPYYLLTVEPSSSTFYLHPGNVYYYLMTPQSGAFGTGGTSVYVRSPQTIINYPQYSYASPAPAFGLAGNQFAVSTGYTFGDPINDTTNFLTTTYGDWGLTPGSSTVYTIDGTSETVTVNVAPIPEIDPAGMGSVFALVTGALGLIERRRVKVA